MSPHQERKKRWFFGIAAFTANGMGAGAGLATQALISDPMTSVLVGTVVSGTVGDILLQVGRARVSRPVSGARSGGHERTEEIGRDGRRGREAGRRHTGRLRQVHARCTQLTSREEQTAVPRPPRTGTEVPQHHRHRHLHRAAQRRVQAKRMERPGWVRGTDASS